MQFYGDVTTAHKQQEPTSLALPSGRTRWQQSNVITSTLLFPTAERVLILRYSCALQPEESDKCATFHVAPPTRPSSSQGSSNGHEQSKNLP
ncbi:hypothetical protein RB195_014094 [Necator americanus]|uniref:ZP domain-containing protein n=1 Tax=Necator americanus TaxID=51031 RepID=A0ABR1DYN9_NECAM